MQTEEQLRLVILDLFEQLLEDNVIYAEIRFAPLLHTENGLSPLEVVTIVEVATAQAVRSTGIEARFILCTLRHYSAKQSLETVQLVEAFRGTTVAGFDIAAFQYAREKRIPCTAHAGEARGPDSVWGTLKHFTPKHLGHGVRSIEDPGLLAYLRDHRIHLEVCPTYNIQTDIYGTYADHPIDRLYRAGLSVCVNTDTRTMTNTRLSQEYKKIHQVFGWNAEDFLQCNKNALEAAFLPDGVRDRLMERLVDGY